MSTGITSFICRSPFHLSSSFSHLFRFCQISRLDVLLIVHVVFLIIIVSLVDFHVENLAYVYVTSGLLVGIFLVENLRVVLLTFYTYFVLFQLRFSGDSRSKKGKVK